MERYIGVKIIGAEPMDKFAFHTEQTGETTKDFSGDKEGYKVIYLDGYVSWSPKEVFEEAYRKINAMTFGLAIEAAKKGFCISREGWNGKNMHVMGTKLYTPENIQVDNDCLLLFNIYGKYNTWVPSITDIMAEDWLVVK